MIEDHWKSLSLIPVQFWLKMTSLTSRSKSFGSSSRDPLGSFGKQALFFLFFKKFFNRISSGIMYSIVLKNPLKVCLPKS